MAWSDAARAAAAETRRRNKRPTVGQNKSEMNMILRQAARRGELWAKTMMRTRMAEVSPGVFAQRDTYAKALRAARSRSAAHPDLKSARLRNIGTRVYAGRAIQASISRFWPRKY
jgi:hypothetical protein